jgi:hypothetical protein
MACRAISLSYKYCISRLIFKDGVFYIDMDRNFVCLWRRHNCILQKTVQIRYKFFLHMDPGSSRHYPGDQQNIFWRFLFQPRVHSIRGQQKHPFSAVISGSSSEEEFLKRSIWIITIAFFAHSLWSVSSRVEVRCNSDLLRISWTSET